MDHGRWVGSESTGTVSLASPERTELPLLAAICPTVSIFHIKQVGEIESTLQKHPQQASEFAS